MRQVQEGKKEGEKKEKKKNKEKKFGFEGVANIDTIQKSPTLMGDGKGGIPDLFDVSWDVLDDKLSRKLFGGGSQPGRLHHLVQWLNFMLSETSGMITLTSP